MFNKHCTTINVAKRKLNFVTGPPPFPHLNKTIIKSIITK